MKKLIFIIFLGLWQATSVYSNEWVGPSSGSWSVGSNWSGGVPVDYDSVLFGASGNLLVGGAAGTLTALNVQQGTFTLALSGTGLSINNLSINSGGFTANLPLTMYYDDVEGQDALINQGASQDAVFNGMVTIPDIDRSLIVSSSSPQASVLFPGGLQGDGGLGVFGAWVQLSVASTYHGGTQVRDFARLLVTNTTGSATGDGPVAVSENSKIGGTGTIGGDVTCESGDSSATIEANLTTGPGAHVPLHISGSLTLNNTAISITGTPSAGTYTLVQAGSISGAVIVGTVDLPLGLAADPPQIVGNTIQVTITGSPIQAWRLSFGWAADGSGTNQGNSQDFDGDGFTNLMEYAFNTDPTLKSSVPRATASISSNHGRISFTRRADRTDINYTVQASSSMTGSFTNIAQSILGGDVTDISGGTSAIDQGTGTVRTVVVTDAALVSSNSKRFYRVQVVYP